MRDEPCRYLGMLKAEIKAGAKALRQYHAWYVKETWERLAWPEEGER